MNRVKQQPNHEMTKKDFIDLLVALKDPIVLGFCVLFGVVAQESYQILKGKHNKIKNFIHKTIVALFICLLITPFVDKYPFLKINYPYVIMLLSFLHRPAADWLQAEFLPFITRQLTKKEVEK